MALSDNEIHLYITRPDQISEPELLQHYQSILTEEERARLPRFYHQRHRHQFLVTRALQRFSLSRHTGVKPDEWGFSQGDYGKPAICRPVDQTHLPFNLSHASGMIVCAISQTAEIGVDVEDGQRSTRAAFSSLFSYFSTEEIAQLESLPDNQQKARFFAHWTLKEAFIKACGAGFAIALNQFGFVFKGGQLDQFFIQDTLKHSAQDWQFWYGNIEGRYPLAIALCSNQRDINIVAHECVPFQTITSSKDLHLSHFRNN